MAAKLGKMTGMVCKIFNSFDSELGVLCALPGDNPISSFAYFAFFAVHFSGSESSVAALPC
jgi:hypothetical protein